MEDDDADGRFPIRLLSVALRSHFSFFPYVGIDRTGLLSDGQLPIFVRRRREINDCSSEKSSVIPTEEDPNVPSVIDFFSGLRCTAINV